MGAKIALGKAVKNTVGIIVKPQTTEERVTLLESRLKAMTHAFYSVRTMLTETQKGHDNEANAYNPGITDMNTNRDGIPIGTTLIGITTDAPYVLNVADNGLYYVNGVPHRSLSSAAKAVGAPLRKSGWRFWKTLDGKAVKEIYRKV